MPLLSKKIINNEKVHNPRVVNLVCDATFYSKRKDKLGTLVFKDFESKEILIWKHIESEIVQDYRYLKEELISLGYSIKSVTLDGKRGLYKALQKIILRLTKTTEKNLINKLDDWNESYKDFLEEKSVSSTTGELHYTNPKIRAAYRNLKTNLPYLFT